jgi:hypothetical protein
LSDAPYRVAGVMPPDFNYPNNTEVWQRLQWDFAQHSRGAHFVESLFRLKPGVTVDRANAELRALTTRLGTEFKATNGEWGARAVPLAHEVEGYFRPALFALFGAAAFLLLITCTNVASLLLARATVREREVAVRAAIGASRGRLVRQFLTESILLALMGTAFGVCWRSCPFARCRGIAGPAAAARRGRGRRRCAAAVVCDRGGDAHVRRVRRRARDVDGSRRHAATAQGIGTRR